MWTKNTKPQDVGEGELLCYCSMHFPSTSFIESESVKAQSYVDVLISRTKGGSWGVRVMVAQGQVTHQWPGQDWHLTALLPCPRYLCRITLNS